MKLILRHTLMVGVLAFCVAGLNVQSQTASPGPSSRNANVDREDPNKPKTPEHEIPAQEAPGSENSRDPGAAGTTTPTGGDGSNATQNRDPTQPVQGAVQKQDPHASTTRDCDILSGDQKEMCEQEIAKQSKTLDQKQQENENSPE